MSDVNTRGRFPDEGRYTMEELVGTEERNWEHWFSKRTMRTMCGFDVLNEPEVIQRLRTRNPFAPIVACPDCQRAHDRRSK